MSKLLSKTRQLLVESPLRLEVISVGSDCPYQWLVALKTNRRGSMPAVDRIERLYEFLSGKQLEV